MALEKAHKAYVNAIVQEEAEKLIFGKPGGGAVNATRAAAQASYDATVAMDKKLRPNAPRDSWHTSTAKQANSDMFKASRKATRKTYKAMKKSGALSALTPSGYAVGAIALAAASSVAVTKPGTDMSRRGFVAGAGVVLGLGLITVPGAAMAENTALIRQLSRAASAYAAQIAPKILSTTASR